jgi:hypothetical protein
MSELSAPTCGTCRHRYPTRDERAAKVGLHNCRHMPTWYYVGGSNPACLMVPSRFEPRRGDEQ